MYVEDITNGNCFSTFIPAESEKEAVREVEGNGECIAVKNANDHKINVDALIDTLRDNQWGKAEIEIITRALEKVGVTE